MSDAMEIGRVVHSIEEFDRLMKDRPEPTPQPAEDREHPANLFYSDPTQLSAQARRQMEDRLHRKPPVIVIIDLAELTDEKVMAALAEKKEIMLKSGDYYDFHPSAMNPLFEMPSKEFIQEYQNEPR